MTSYKIVSSAGVEMGTYEADSEEGALDAMAHDAGYPNADEATYTVGPFDGTVTEVTADVESLAAEVGIE